MACTLKLADHSDPSGLAARSSEIQLTASRQAARGLSQMPGLGADSSSNSSYSASDSADHWLSIGDGRQQRFWPETGREGAPRFLGVAKICVAAAFLALAAGAHAVETAKQPWEQYSKRVEASQSVTQLGSDLFGDKVNTQDGGLSFSATDVSLPGNSVLPVSFTRSYTVRPGQDYRSDLMLGDWDIEVPNVSGVFAPNWLSGNQAAPGNRCSTQHRPKLPTVPVGAYVPHRDFWHGNHIQIPGVGGGEILLSNTGSHWGITNDQIRISCLSSIKNGTGEGFLAEAPDGTRYWFDWMAQYYEPGIEFRVEQTQLVPLRKNVLYATRVEDRFGNRVNYTYTNQWAQPGKLTTIEASDGRRIDIGYLDGRISTIVAAGRSWNYLYGTAGGKATLTQVTQPDGSRWGIGFSEFGTAKIEYPTGSIAEPARSCIMHATPKVYIQPSGTITHPSGAVGFFQVQIQRHGKSNVPLSCDNVTTTGPGSPGHDNDPNDDINQFVIDYDKFSIKTKQITGPGLPPYQWGYSYSADISFVLRSGTSIRYPVCVLSYEQCHQPTCTSDSCAGTSRLTVTGPAGEWIRYTHGNSFRYNEGKLLKVETGTSASNVLRTHLSAYDLTLIDQAYPANYGISLRTDSEAFTSEYHRPLRETKINQQGVTFTRVVELFDGFARPLIETKSSTVVGNPIKTDATEYYDDLSLWVLGQVKRMTTNGVETSRTEFSWKALPEKAYRFGKLQQTLTYETALSAQVGTIKTVTDGNNNVTTLGNWFRGVPRLIKYPATPEAPSGATQTAVVDLNGWITAVLDELGYKTCYQHDLMGRTKLVSYPSDEKILPQICDTDQRTWKQTASTFVQVQVAEYEIPAGHWRQTVTTGNATRISYFDAFWRPILTREFDAANVAGTQGDHGSRWKW